MKKSTGTTYTSDVSYTSYADPKDWKSIGVELRTVYIFSFICLLWGFIGGLKLNINFLIPSYPIHFENYHHSPKIEATQTKNEATLYYKEPMALNDATINFLHSKEAEGLKILPDPSVEWKLDGSNYTKQIGKASWYDYKLKGYPNYSKENYTAASRDYPRGTELLVCRTDKKADETDKSKNLTIDNEPYLFIYKGEYLCVKVRVNDYVENPNVIIDISSKAFSELAPLSKGIIDVEITKL